MASHRRVWGPRGVAVRMLRGAYLWPNLASRPRWGNALTPHDHGWGGGGSRLGAVVRGGGVGAPPHDVQPPAPSLDYIKHKSHKYVRIVCNSQKVREVLMVEDVQASRVVRFPLPSFEEQMALVQQDGGCAVATKGMAIGKS